ncbi:Fc.00g006440.m01.CDS01 [Cosmosporella sp. VM-42]
MGYWPYGLIDALRALFLTALLFAGPLYECLIIDGAWRQWLHLEPLAAIYADWPTWRNMVAGPITEECLFRSAGVPLLLQAGASLTGTIFLSPLVFGLAHLHHFYEFRITHPRTPLPVAIARSLLQLSYTSLFGAYATFIFMRTGSLLAVILVHAFCNSMGLPRLWGQVEPIWLLERGEVASSSTRLWTAVYYSLLVAGLVAWWQNLYSLTETPMAIANF